MPGREVIASGVGAVAVLAISLGCAPARIQSPATTLLPASAPANRANYLETEPPPPIDTRADVEVAPRFIGPPPVPPLTAGSKADALVREAEWYFQSGRKKYLEGDVDDARRDFDRAVDLLLSAPDDAGARLAADRKLDQLVDSIYRIDLAGLGAGDNAAEPAFPKAPIEDLPQLTFPVDPALKDKVAEELRATSSQLPLEQSEAVLSYVTYFSSGRGKRVLTSGLERAGRYRAMIQRIFDEEGVPQELIFLAQAESGFLPRAVSRKRATGMWQFMRLRGRQYGLLQTPYSDDRLDPEKATRAAARHLRDLYHHFGDWYLAIAAYNCGPGVIDRAVERTGYADFWELRRRNVLPKETANYVPAILAMTIVAKNAKEYGLDDVDPDEPLDYDTIEMGAKTHLQLVADLADCPVSELHDLNPALLKNVAPEGALLRVPKGSGATLIAALESIPAAKRTAWRVHRVAGGETLAAIARRYHVTERSLVAANGKDAVLEAGNLLIVPAAPVVERVRRAAHRRGTPSRRAALVHRPAPAARRAKVVPVARSAANIVTQRGKRASARP
jgi:membrane-bound lytic murein transglycosylase D